MKKIIRKIRHKRRSRLVRKVAKKQEELKQELLRKNK